MPSVMRFFKSQDKELVNTCFKKHRLYLGITIVRIRGREVYLEIVFPNGEPLWSGVFRKRFRFESQHRKWLIIHN